MRGRYGSVIGDCMPGGGIGSDGVFISRFRWDGGPRNLAWFL
jgi:hypothetical protein